MNPVKKILVNFKTPRGIYEPSSVVYHRKQNPSTQKEDNRMKRRLKKINRYDDEETGEPPIESLSSNKAKLIFKMLTEFHNNHRLTRKDIAKEEKAEYIKKCKEFSLFKANQWRKTFNSYRKSMAAEDEVLKSAGLLPEYLMEEVMDLENQEDLGNTRFTWFWRF